MVCPCVPPARLRAPAPPPAARPAVSCTRSCPWLGRVWPRTCINPRAGGRVGYDVAECGDSVRRSARGRVAMPGLSMLSDAYAAGSPVGSGRRRPGGPAVAVRRRGLALLLGLVAVVAAGVAAPARAQTVPVVADQYDVDLTVQTDGALAVEERLSLDFAGGPFRHGQRIISLARVGAINDV